MIQADTQAATSLHAVPKDPQAQSDWNNRLEVMIVQLQRQVADLQSLVISQQNAGFTGSATFGTGHTMTIAKGTVTGYS